MKSLWLCILFLTDAACAFSSGRSTKRINLPTPLFFEMPEYKDGTEYAMNNKDINNILAQNKAYVEALGQDFFDDLGARNEPKYMWIGCSDARASANEIMVRVVIDAQDVILPKTLSGSKSHSIS
jgi:hypothetical protein